MSNQAVIAIGSNIQPGEYVARALREIAAAHTLVQKSRFIWTKPLGGPPQPDYLNGAVLIETAMDRPTIAAWLKELEKTLGREKSADKFAPRTIDLDLVVWNGQIVHDDVRSRDFVRNAVLELLPQLPL